MIELLSALVCSGSCCFALALVVVAVGVLAWLGSGPDTPEGAREELVRIVQDFRPPGSDLDHEPTAAELATTNEVGRLLFRGQPDDAVTVLDQALSTARPEARGDLLNQKGGALWMLGRFEDARAIYAEQVTEDPSDLTALGNLVEADGKLGSDEVFLGTLAQWRSAGGEPPHPERFDELVAIVRNPPS